MNGNSISRPRVDLGGYTVIPLWFGCNNDCCLCMLAGMRQHLPPIGFDRFCEVVTGLRRQGRCRNLILSGAEVTTLDDLFRYVEFAASLEWFDRIQIQTNGRRLSDHAYLSGLVARGVNEFFVSIHGTETVHDAITRRPGSYRQTMQGIRNLAGQDANLISNTVMTTANQDDLETLLAILSAEAISEFHLWNFFPMRAQDRVELIVPLNRVVEQLPRLREMLGPGPRPLVLKGFPHCLPAPAGVVFDSRFPETILPKAFWEAFDESRFGACPHRQQCADRLCWGLSGAYREQFGDERQRLQPLPEKDRNHEG